jgi:hypothetical protein
MHPVEESLNRWSRRAFFQHTGLNLGAIALGSLLNDTLSNTALGAKPQANGKSMVIDDPLVAKKPHFKARAKNVIYLHMIGAPSHLDLFDPKPELVKRDGQTCPDELTKGKRFAFIGNELTLAGSQFKFAQHGQCGHNLSELLPNLAGVADELAIVHSIHSEEINHAPAQMFLHTGFGRGGRPSLGSWVTYGLGSENSDLPAYVVMLSGPLGGAGTSLWSAGFLPSVYQGVQFRSTGDAVLFLSNPDGQTPADRRRILDAVRDLNQAELADVGDPEIATRISQYEMAYRMQTSVPELMDLAGESPETLELYGAQPGKASFANNCLLARRLVERGVRMVQLYDADWDHHTGLGTRLPGKCKEVDRPMAALISDLKRRGLLDDTLVIWGGEFGRTPLRQGSSANGATVAKAGRDHHKDAFTMWMAGGGVKPGVSYGTTDPFGFNVADNPVHVHDLNATVLHLLGLDHERLTFKYQGREFRLTDVAGHVATDLLA